jgi:hypothetical protein
LVSISSQRTTAVGAEVGKRTPQRCTLIERVAGVAICSIVMMLVPVLTAARTAVVGIAVFHAM